MRAPALLLTAALVTATLTAPALTGTGSATPLPSAPGCPVLPASSVWHADVSRLPVHSRSAQWLSRMQATSRSLHPDFGPSYGDQPVPYGIPVTTVTSSHPRVSVDFDYADESDPGPYPLGSDSKVEGGSGAGGDRHVLIVDKGSCTLYELWDTHYRPSGSSAGSGAVFDLRSNALRPAGWTSADAAGLPILPGLLRYAEVAAGHVDHAIRFTAPTTDRRYLWPARHQAGSVDDPTYPPMGARFRLRSGYPTSGLRADTKVVIAALKAHGLLLADNGSSFYVQGDQDSRWPDGLLDELKAIPASAFEAVDESVLQLSPGSGRARSVRVSKPVTYAGGTWRLRDGVVASSSTTVSFGAVGDVPVVGDWDGDGTATIGTFHAGTWRLRSSNDSSGRTSTVAFGQAGDLPVVGDWDGDGRDGIGVFRAGRWLLRQTATSGSSSYCFAFGSAGDVPVAGDWDRDGRDGIGTFRAGQWRLRDALSAGSASTAFAFGTTGDRPVVGDWDKDARDTVGVVRGHTWRLRNTSSAGQPTATFGFGADGDQVLTRD